MGNPPQYSPQTSKPELMRSQRFPPGGLPGGNVSRHGSAALGGGGGKCTQRAVRVPGGGKSWKLMLCGQGSAGAAVGSLQAFNRRVDTLSVLSLICRVK